MLRSIYQIGKRACEGKDCKSMLLDEAVKRYSDSIKNREEKDIAVVDFDLDRKLVKVEQKYRFSTGNSRMYLFLGSRTRGSALQNRLSAKKKDYLFGETIYVVKSELEEYSRKGLITDAMQNLKDNVEAIYETMFEGKGKKCFLKNGVRVEDFTDDKEVAFYTVRLTRNGSSLELAATEGYRDYMYYDMLNALDSVRGLCFLCGRKGTVIACPTFPSSTILKIFVRDKGGFLSGVSKSDDATRRTFSICPECFSTLLLGNYYITNRLKTFYAGKDVYILPALVGEPVDFNQFVQVKDTLTKTFRSIKEVEDQVKNLGNIEMIQFTFVFGESVQARFHLAYMLKDVPVTRVTMLLKTMGRVAKECGEILGEHVFLDFPCLDRMFPSSGSAKKDFFVFLESLLKGNFFPKKVVARKSIMLAKAFRSRRLGEYGFREDESFSKTFIKYSFVIKIMNDMMISEGGKVDESLLQELDEDLRKWISKIGLDEEEASLFLHGYIVGMIGDQQGGEEVRKPILEKIGFEGMSTERLVKFSNEVFKSLKIYRLLGKGGTSYSVAKILLQKNLEHWSKSSDENIHHILSGYAFYNIVKDKRREGGESEQ
jgi:CRISPR-associated Csh1 family protein